MWLPMMLQLFTGMGNKTICDKFIPKPELLFEALDEFACMYNAIPNVGALMCFRLFCIM